MDEEKLEGIYLDCKNYGKDVCHPDVRKWKLAKNIGPGGIGSGDIPEVPPYSQLDQICNKCDNKDI